MRSTTSLLLLLASAIPAVFASSSSLRSVRLVAQAHDSGGAAATMHGGAPQSGPAKLAEVSLAPGLKDTHVESFFRGLAEAIKTRDGKPLLSRLAAGYTIEGLPAEWEIRESFVKAIGMIPGPDEMVVTAIKREGDIKIVTAEFRFATRVANKVFKFDAEDKLLNTDFIAMKRAPAPTAPAKPESAKSEAKK